MNLGPLPAPLKPGDRLWVTLPSGTLREPEVLHQGLDIWRSRGYHIDLCPDYGRQWGYLAGTDDQRRTCLETGLKQPDYKAILCGRGGYGGARLLEQWVWPPTPPQWLVGFSDVTSLLWSMAQQGIAGGVHGPVLTSLTREPDWSHPANV